MRTEPSGVVMMKVLITGATGFIGSWTVDACLRRNMVVAALTMPDQEQVVMDHWHGAVRPLLGTLSNPPWHEIEDFAPDACLHAAWITTPGEYLDSLVNRDFHEWSQAFFAKLIQSNTSHIVGIGSCAEYTLKEIQNPIGSSTGSRNESLYARYKNELRVYLENLAQPGVTQWAWARLFYPYGPGEAADRLCSAAVRALLSGNVFKLKCPLAKKDYIFVRDVAEGLACILQHGGRGIFDVGTGRATTLRQVLEEMAGQIGCLNRLQLGEDIDRLGTLQANPKPLKALGWRASVSLQSGLEELIAAYRQEISTDLKRIERADE